MAAGRWADASGQLGRWASGLSGRGRESGGRKLAGRAGDRPGVARGGLKVDSKVREASTNGSMEGLKRRLGGPPEVEEI